MAVRARRGFLVSHGDMGHPSFGQSLRGCWHRVSPFAVFAVSSLLLGGCAELVEFRSDLAHLRSDLQANTYALSRLSTRVDELERRQSEAEATARQAQHDLSQAIEVLLRKALIAEGRQTTYESGKSWPKDAKNSESQASQPAAMGGQVSSRGGTTHPGGKQLSLGMSQDEVRRLFGEPTNIEPVGPYEFWHYSPLNNQQYIVFDQTSGQVLGWRVP